MPTYAIGDIQGCREQLESLLEAINFDPVTDKLWFAGDLVNRGPDSIGSLRLIHSIKDSVVAVLGNHDLHMLAVREDRNRANRKDTFFDVLDAHDVDILLDWLVSCPLVHSEDNYIMVHAGVHPLWSKSQLLALSAEVEAVLQSNERTAFFQTMYGNQPDQWSDKLQGFDRLRFITNVLTRMRYCHSNLALNMQCKGSIEKAPEGLIPWFDVVNRVNYDDYILHGHWAALMGGESRAGIISLDTGCVWGNKLSAWCLEEKRWYSVPGMKEKQS